MEEKLLKESKNDIQEFENESLGFKVRCIKNDDGSISMNAEDTAISFGWFEQRNDKTYPRWRTINGFIKYLGFS